MTAVRPAVAFNEIIEQIKSYLDRGELPSEMEAKKLMRDAEKLATTDRPQWAWVAKSAVASLLWKVDDVVSLAEQGARAVGANADILANLAISLRHVCMVDEAARLTGLSARAEPLTFKFVERYVLDLVALGALSRALGTAQQFRDRVRGSELQQRADALVEVVQSGVEVLKLAGVSEDELQTELAIALDVMKTERVRYSYFRLVKETDPNGNSVAYAELGFSGDFEDELRLGAVLAPRLARLADWNPSKLALDLKYVMPEHVHVAV